MEKSLFFHCYDYLDKVMTSDQRPVLGTSLKGNILLRISNITQQTAPLSDRTVGSISSFAREPANYNCIPVYNPAVGSEEQSEREIDRFRDICHESWGEVKLKDLIESIFREGTKFGGYFHSQARAFDASTLPVPEDQRVRYLSCGIRKDGNHYLLEDIVGDEYKDEIHQEKFR
jgi:hypothetical protein